MNGVASVLAHSHTGHTHLLFNFWASYAISRPTNKFGCTFAHKNLYCRNRENLVPVKRWALGITLKI